MERGEKSRVGVTEVSDEILYKVEMPANRYDLLSLEGLSRAIRVYLGESSVPEYRVVKPVDDKIIQLIQSEETVGVRQFVVGAVLRNVTLTQERYNSLIDLQDKLHLTIGRKRALVAIGTHDLDTIQAPFYYKAQSKGLTREFFGGS